MERVYSLIAKGIVGKENSWMAISNPKCRNNSKWRKCSNKRKMRSRLTVSPSSGSSRIHSPNQIRRP
jgi:hypothetical protein